MLKEDRIQAFLRRYGPYGIQTLFCNYGEPLLNPDTPLFISLARRYLTQTVISTNLSVTRFDPHAYVASGLDYMTLSIDGATQAVYARYRQNGNIDVVYRNIKALVEARAKSGRRTPVICWQYLAFEHNVHEIPLAIGKARELGVDEFKITRPFDVSWDDPAMRPAKIQPQTLQFNLKAGCDIIENQNLFPGDLDAAAIDHEFETAWTECPEAACIVAAPRSLHTCHWLYKNITMDAHGRIFPCAGAPKQGDSFLFSRFEGFQDDPYNSEKHRRARLFFSDKHGYSSNTDPAGGNDPYCVHCDWTEDQMKSDIDSSDVDNYLRTAGPALFSPESRRILSSW